jgi:hypothetical protein
VTFELKNLDLSVKSFEEFVQFFFARRPVPDDQQFEYYSHDLAGVKYDEFKPSSPKVVVHYMTRLFSNFGTIAPAYSLAQVDQAVWGMFGENLRLYEFLWNRAIELEDRLRCIRSMYFVFSDFVGRNEVAEAETAFSMWWDLFLFSFWVDMDLKNGRGRTYDISVLDADERTVVDTAFETLTRVLSLADLASQFAALHGLGHLHHPDVSEAVQGYIDKHKGEFTPERLDWIQRCKDGRIQ